MRTTDMADELFSGAAQPLPAGVRLATARHGGVTVTRVEIAREGLSRPRGRYVTLEMPSVSVLDERDAAVIEVCARELRALLPPEGPVLVLGVGNRTPAGSGCAAAENSSSAISVVRIFHTLRSFLGQKPAFLPESMGKIKLFQTKIKKTLALVREIWYHRVRCYR